MESIAAVTFDCYGTLIDWETGIRQSFNTILKAKGAKIDVKDFQAKWNEIEFALIQGRYQPYKTILRKSLKKTMEHFKLRYNEADGDLFAESMSTWNPFPDVMPTLRELGKRSMIAIISNTDNDIIHETVRKIGVSFDRIITTEDAKAYKPSPKIFQHAIKIIGATPAQILHTSFSFKYDLNPGKRLGFQTVWVKRKSEKDERGKRDFEVVDLRGLLNIISE